jgi:hypothetical protein
MCSELVLSSYKRGVGRYWENPSSCRIDCRYSIVLPASDAAINSTASMEEESAIVGWYLDL